MTVSKLEARQALLTRIAKLNDELTTLQREADAMERAAMAEARTQIREIMAKHNLDPEALLPKTRKVYKLREDTTKTRRGPQPPLYRDPLTGKTWNGFGRAPAWLADLPDRSKYLIAQAN